MAITGLDAAVDGADIAVSITGCFNRPDPDPQNSAASIAGQYFVGVSRRRFVVAGPNPISNTTRFFEFPADMPLDRPRQEFKELAIINALTMVMAELAAADEETQ